MAAIVLSLVYRQINYLTDVLRCLEVEGLLWVEAMSVSRQALSQRLESLPAQLFSKLFEQVVERLAAKKNSIEIALSWASVAEKFSAVWIADASTLEAVKKHLGQLQQKTGAVLGGKMLMVVEAFSHRPVAAFFDADAKRKETKWWGEITQRPPVGGLLITDMGFYGFEWFDSLTEARKYVLTRQKAKVRYQVVRCLSSSSHYKDEIIQIGLNHTDLSCYPMRQVSVLWGKTWYHYLTNVLDPQQLSPQQVCDLYRRRWKIEDAFLLTKRLLGLSYLWVGGTNGVQMLFLCYLDFLCSTQ